ncbi:hypothetical protein BN2497_12705 [Janthinobacterium sp. CG23_2]|nr:hypothetical protein BN2497_12705 [Janthinobacterium sp. CG23_2]CUU32750.1 hypothetical protein BN3177_12705 [Janthinobacterium sp. CG23_2]
MQPDLSVRMQSAPILFAAIRKNKALSIFDVSRFCNVFFFREQVDL